MEIEVLGVSICRPKVSPREGLSAAFGTGCGPPMGLHQGPGPLAVTRGGAGRWWRRHLRPGLRHGPLMHFQRIKDAGQLCLVGTSHSTGTIARHPCKLRPDKYMIKIQYSYIYHPKLEVQIKPKLD